jgi:hypothetical protein
MKQARFIPVNYVLISQRYIVHDVFPRSEKCLPRVAARGFKQTQIRRRLSYARCVHAYVVAGQEAVVNDPFQHVDIVLCRLILQIFFFQQIDIGDDRGQRRF